jgi:uncharacterized protein (DUF1810 family)
MTDPFHLQRFLDAQAPVCSRVALPEGLHRFAATGQLPRP